MTKKERKNEWMNKWMKEKHPKEETKECQGKEDIWKTLKGWMKERTKRKKEKIKRKKENHVK